MSYRIFGLGEVLWDLFPAGRRLGGAPANFAYHARALGADARIVSRVGRDELGREIWQNLESLKIPTDGLSVDAEHPTGTVTVEVDAAGQPVYVIHEGVAWDYLEPSDKLRHELARAEAVCFGSLAQRSERSRQTIRALVEQTPLSAVRVFDVNLRQHYFSAEIIEESLRLANVVKLNDLELPVIGDLLGLAGTPRELMAALRERGSLRLVVCTRGGEGSLLYDGTSWCESAALAVPVRDTVGAGDAFTAAITMGLLAGWGLEKMAEFANQVAAYVCSCDGATPPLPPELRERFRAEVA
jgi:fructokinase